MSSYTVNAVHGPSPWQSQQGGTFHEYRLGLDGVEKLVSLNQKPETPAPQVGQTLTLDLLPHPKFPELMRGKKVQAPNAGQQALGDDVTRASIESQVCLKAAVEYACGFSQPPDAEAVVLTAKRFYAALREMQA